MVTTFRGGTAVLAPPATAQAQDRLSPADGVPRATITRTSNGIPHVVAEDFESLGLGQGYATAEDIACSLADTLVTGRGERSLFFGPDEVYDDGVTLRATNLQVDTVFRNLRERKVVEALMEDVAGGGAVNQVWDVVLLPGRFCVRVASGVLKRDDG